MRKKTVLTKIARLAKLVYLKLFRINDSPLKIALGFGLGVFIGVMPAMGPPVAFVLALILRVNRASALLGSILFNTWIGVLSLLFAIRVGSTVTGLEYARVRDGWNGLIKGFKWERLLEVSVYTVLVPIVIGYSIISLVIASVATVAVYVIARRIKMKKAKAGAVLNAKIVNRKFHGQKMQQEPHRDVK
ncbi:MAG: DUF2062 domain-containing protein [Candidatus Omnitrophota bacterium]